MNNPWKEITIPIKDVSALRVQLNHPLDLFWAMDNIGRYLFIYEYPYNSELVINDPPELEGIEVVSRTLSNDKSRLILILVEKINWELFLALCNDLVSSTIQIDNPRVASKIILQRLRRWSSFLKNKKSDILSEEKIKGLIGELLFVNLISRKYTISDAVNFWIGPEGAPQDFIINNSAIEVKCQSGGSIPTIQISSENQLVSQLSNLFLYVVTLGKASSSNPDLINLPILISGILSSLETESTSLSIFQDKLMDVGYYYSDKYLDYNYIVSAEHMFKVKDGFPRICPDELQQGVMQVTYRIKLEDCYKFEIDINRLEV